MPEAAPPPFDAVLFDLDGTLVATDRYWIAAAREGARRGFAELGIERAMPSDAEWMGMVGYPLIQGFDQVFADLDPDSRRLVMTRCQEEEHRLLAAGFAAPMPGAIELLHDLKRQGVRTGIASNCSLAYLRRVLEGLSIEDLIDEALCLESEGIHDKAGMIARLLERFGTRSAVMIGDRASDARAACANGVPSVHLDSGFAQAGETIPCDAVISMLAELPDLLDGRSRWIRTVLEEEGALAGPDEARRVRTLGVTGASGAGKSLFARDAVRIARSLGRPVTAVSLEDHVELGAGVFDPGREGAFERLAASLLEPHARGQARLVPEGGLLILEGPYLTHPRPGAYLDRILTLEAPEELRLRRIGSARGPEGPAEYRRRILPLERAFEAEFAARGRADRVLDGSRPLGSRQEATLRP